MSGFFSANNFRFMPQVFDMISATPQANMNIDYNLWNSQLSRDSIMYMTPNFQGGICLDYPMFGTFGNNLLDPNLAIQQTLQAFNNGSWMNCNNNNNWFNNMFRTPWNNTSNTSNNSSNSVADKVKQAEYDTLKSILTAYKNSNKLSPAMEAKIEDALSKSGTIDEKLSAIKDVLKTLPVDKLKSAVLSNENLKAKLASCGYNLSEGKLNKEDDAKLRGLLESVKQELNYSPAKYDTLLAQVCSSEADPDILRTISYWNDKNPGENIIKMIAGKINTTKGEGTNQENAVKKLAMSLINKANTIQEAYSSDFTKLKAAQKDVSDALTKVNGNNGFTKANLEDLAKKFDKLYAMLRIIEANAVSAEAKTEFQKIMNDATGKTIIPDDFIVAETKADLKKEGITIPDVDSIEEADVTNNDDEIASAGIDEKETVEEKIEALKGDEGNKSIVGSAKEGVFKTNTTSTTEKPHFYFVKDDKILELKDVVDIDANGKCTMKDGTEKTLEDAKKETTEVNPSDIMQYKSTLERVEKLTKDGSEKRLKACSTKLGDNTLYASMGKNLQGHHQYFVVKDGKLMQIKCIAVYTNGKIKTEAGNKTFAELTDADFEEIDDSDILKEDEKETVSNQTETVDMNDVGEMYDLADKLGLTETSIIGYYQKGSKYYKYNPSEQKMEELKDVTAVHDDGTVTQNGNKVAVREVEEPDQAGKILRNKLSGDTSTESYKVIKRKINSFSTYTEADDIYKFLYAYDDERSGWCQIDSRICAQIATENGLTKNEKKEYLKTIAKKTLTLAQKAGMSSDSEEIQDLNNFIQNGEIDQSWYSWNRIQLLWCSKKLTVAARGLDDIIKNVLEEYEAKKSETNS